MTEPWRWQHADGRPGYTPDEYYKLGQLSTVADRLYDLVGPGSGGGIYDGLDASPAEIAAVDQAVAEAAHEEAAGMYEDDDYDAYELLAEMDAALQAELDEPGDGGYGLSNSYGPVAGPVSAALAAGDRAAAERMSIIRLARATARQQYAETGSIYDLCAGYAETGTEGHGIELANAPGPDAALELARDASGQFGHACGGPTGAIDRYGRCMSRQHQIGCTANTAQAAATGSAAEIAAWNDTARRSAGLALRDAVFPYGAAG